MRGFVQHQIERSRKKCTGGKGVNDATHDFGVRFLLLRDARREKDDAGKRDDVDDDRRPDGVGPRF